MASFKIHLLLLFTLPALSAGAAQAATITVDAGGVCSLADAITAANTDTAAGGCAAGSGADAIILEMDITLAAALPEITSTVIIEGGGHKIDGNSLAPALFKGNSSGAVLRIAISGVLTLNKAVITGGRAACYCGSNGIISSGGGIYNEGQLSVNNSTVSGNAADGIHTNMGSLTVSNTTISESKPSAVCMIAGCEGVGSGGGGIYVSGGGIAILRSSIVSGNFGREILIWEGTIIADSHNVFGHSDKSNEDAFYGFTPGSKDITATSDGTKPTALASILSPLAANGVHALVAGSPAIDADMTCSTNLTTDQQGHPRPVGLGCDAGAVEYNPSNTDSDSDGLADAARSLLTLTKRTRTAMERVIFATMI
ncbi:choice-of-anchor Q domain-containing protein [Candidatus Electronema sp. PJ]|uniref:choice-of-anchor Q domain-containing protein n=1 Tax=Candidatus Electronema sp. PJ TaxID=3401572 RepID=UPI003AA91B4D